MITHIMAFGDSFMYGHETPSSDTDVSARLNAAFPNQQLDHTGAIPNHIISAKHYATMQQVTDSIPSYDERCLQYCLSGYLASKLDIEYQNYSCGGYSNDAIMAELLQRLPYMDQHTLVLVGLTYPSRKTQLSQRTAGDRILTLNNYAQFTDVADQKRYLELDMHYGDDILVKLLQVSNHVRAIHDLLRDIPHVLIDPTNIYRQNSELNQLLFAWPMDTNVKRFIRDLDEPLILPAIANTIQSCFDQLLFGYTLNHAMLELHQQGSRCRELGGHPTRHSHQLFVDNYLWPHLYKEGWIS